MSGMDAAADVPETPFDRSLLPAALRDADLEALAREFGTPLFVYDEEHLRRRCRDYVGQFGAENVAYAGKAFLCTAMARLVAEEGLHLDVASEYLEDNVLRQGYLMSRAIKV